MADKKKLLFVINTMGRAGAEKSLIEFLHTLSGDSYDIDLLVMINRGEMYRQLPDYVHILNRHPDSASVLTLGGRIAVAGRSLQALTKNLWLFKNLKYLRENLRVQRKRGRIRGELTLWKAISDSAIRTDIRYDLAVAYIEGASAYYVAEHVNAAKKCAFIHTDYVRAGYTPEIDSRCYDKIDRVFVVSNQAKQHFCEVYPEHEDKVYLFRNIINADEIRRKSLLSGGFTDSCDGARLLTVGRLCPEKAYDVAIAAAKLLKERGVNFKWYVLGDGVERGKLEALIKKTGVEDVFYLLGSVDNPYNYMAQSDIYVHETRYEGKSVAVEEAQTLNLPIIASDCDGNTEQITSGYDGIITKLEPIEIADTIQRLINDADLRKLLSENNKSKQIKETGDVNRFLELLK